MRKKSMPELEQARLAAVKSFQPHPLRLVLENIRSAENVGAMFRLADVFGIQGIDICGITPCPPKPDISRAALGAENTVPWQYVENLPEYLKGRKDEGFMIAALELVHNSTYLQSWQPADQPVLLILGHEVDGISNEILELCDLALEIPQFGRKHSLNVATATAVALWEFLRKTSLKT